MRFLWGIVILVLSQSSFAIISSPVLLPHNRYSKPCTVPDYSVVDIAGDINVNLHTGYGKPSLVLFGDARDLKQVKVHVSRQGVLFVSLKNTPRYGSILADVRGHYLNGFAYKGNGTITGMHLRANLTRLVIHNQGSTVLKGTVRLGYLEIHGRGYTQIGGVVSPKLHVKLSDQAKVKLTGRARLEQLDMDGKSWFSLSWEDSPNLVVRASDKAYIQLAGIVNKMDVETRDYAQFNGRFLRATRAFVKTYGNSVAKISTTQHQHLLASDASDIRTYNLPEIKTDFMAFDGAVLDMRDVNTSFVQEPTPYNR